MMRTQAEEIELAKDRVHACREKEDVALQQSIPLENYAGIRSRAEDALQTARDELADARKLLDLARRAG